MNLRPGQIVTLVAGLVLVIFSFFTFYDVGGDDLRAECDAIDIEDVPAEFRADYETACGLAGGVSAWNMDLGFPLFTWPAILGLVVAGLLAANTFGNFEPPEIAGFSLPQLLVALATSGALIMVGLLIMGTDDGESWGIGFWFMLLGSLALLAGTVMELLQGPNAKPAAAFGGPTSFGSGPGFGQPPAGPPGPGGPPQGPPPQGPPPGSF